MTMQIAMLTGTDSEQIEDYLLDPVMVKPNMGHVFFEEKSSVVK